MSEQTEMPKGKQTRQAKPEGVGGARKEQAGNRKEFTREQQQFIAMGKIGAKLGGFGISPEDMEDIFEDLAEHPEEASTISDALNTVQQKEQPNSHLIEANQAWSEGLIVGSQDIVDIVSVKANR